MIACDCGFCEQLRSFKKELAVENKVEVDARAAAKAQGAAEERTRLLRLLDEEANHQAARRNEYGNSALIALERLRRQIVTRGDHKKGTP